MGRQTVFYMIATSGGIARLVQTMSSSQEIKILGPRRCWNGREAANTETLSNIFTSFLVLLLVSTISISRFLTCIQIYYIKFYCK